MNYQFQVRFYIQILPILFAQVNIGIKKFIESLSFLLCDSDVFLLRKYFLRMLFCLSYYYVCILACVPHHVIEISLFVYQLQGRADLNDFPFGHNHHLVIVSNRV